MTAVILSAVANLLSFCPIPENNSKKPIKYAIKNNLKKILQRRERRCSFRPSIAIFSRALIACVLVILIVVLLTCGSS